MTSPVNLKSLSDTVREKHWNQLISEVNDSCLRLAVNEGIFDWHYHSNSDELFIVLEGELEIEFRDREPLRLRPGDSFTVPAGVVHRTIARTRTVNMCFEKTASDTVFVREPSR